MCLNKLIIYSDSFIVPYVGGKSEGRPNHYMADIRGKGVRMVVQYDLVISWHYQTVKRVPYVSPCKVWLNGLLVDRSTEASQRGCISRLSHNDPEYPFCAQSIWQDRMASVGTCRLGQILKLDFSTRYQVTDNVARFFPCQRLLFQSRPDKQKGIP